MYRERTLKVVDQKERMGKGWFPPKPWLAADNKDFLIKQTEKLPTRYGRKKRERSERRERGEEGERAKRRNDEERGKEAAKQGKSGKGADLHHTRDGCRR
jgi:hypothetical protein